MLRMQPHESILDLQKRFSHLTNHLMSLGKTCTNDLLNIKVLKYLKKAWKPKVTAISENKSLSKICYAALYDKLQEHEIELEKLEGHKDERKNSKVHSLKTRVKNHDSN